MLYLLKQVYLNLRDSLNLRIYSTNNNFLYNSDQNNEDKVCTKLEYNHLITKNVVYQEIIDSFNQLTII